jgi:hypothetical protein
MLRLLVASLSLCLHVAIAISGDAERFANSKLIKAQGYEFNLLPNLSVGMVSADGKILIESCGIHVKAKGDKGKADLGSQLNCNAKALERGQADFFSIDSSSWAKDNGAFFTYKCELKALPSCLKLHYEVEILKDPESLGLGTNVIVEISFIANLNRTGISSPKPKIEEGDRTVIYETASGEMLSFAYYPPLVVKPYWADSMRYSFRTAVNTAEKLAKGDKRTFDIDIQLP